MPQGVSILPHGGFISFDPHLPVLWKSLLRFYAFPLNVLAVKTLLHFGIGSYFLKSKYIVSKSI